MIIYQTNSGLRYKCFAYFIRLKKIHLGYTYLCIGKNEDNDTIYLIGEINKMESWEVERSSYRLEDSPLSGTFLFESFLKTLKE